MSVIASVIPEHCNEPITTPFILNIIIVSTKYLFHVYQCQYASQSNLVKFNTQAKTLLSLSSSSTQRADCWSSGRAKGPKGTVSFGKVLAKMLNYTAYCYSIVHMLEHTVALEVICLIPNTQYT